MRDSVFSREITPEHESIKAREHQSKRATSDNELGSKLPRAQDEHVAREHESHESTIVREHEGIRARKP